MTQPGNYIQTEMLTPRWDSTDHNTAKLKYEPKPRAVKPFHKRSRRSSEGHVDSSQVVKKTRKLIGEARRAEADASLFFAYPNQAPRLNDAVLRQVRKSALVVPRLITNEFIQAEGQRLLTGAEKDREAANTYWKEFGLPLGIVAVRSSEAFNGMEPAENLEESLSIENFERANFATGRGEVGKPE